MAVTTFGIGGYTAELTVEGNSAKYHFVDPEDITNTEDVSLSSNDLNGYQAESAQAADIAFNKARTSLDETRDERKKQEAVSALDHKQAQDKIDRDAAIEYQANAEELETKPTRVETDSDGNVVSRIFSGDSDSVKPEAPDASDSNNKKK